MNARAWILQGDCIETLRQLPDACMDSVVTDPPYGLSREPDVAEVMRHWCAEELRAVVMQRLHTIGWVRRADNESPGTPAELAATIFPPDDYTHTGGGFMGKTWDSFVPGPAVWREVYRVLKPGGHVLSFFGTRTYHLGVIAMCLAGFEIRDQLAWMYGSGFPKSLDIAKQDGCAAWSGWGTALKPAQEPIVLARKPLVGTVAANVLAHGTGGINVDGCRIETTDNLNGGAYSGERRDSDSTHTVTLGRGIGTFEQPAGRWPANVLLDETAAAMLDAQRGTTKRQGRTHGADMGAYQEGAAAPQYGDSGGASRFFYVAKASRSEREAGLDHLPKHTAGELTDREDGSDGLKSPRAGAGRTSQGRANNHPTVKPIALMRYLVRLITPQGGTVLDPFAGSGTTLVAAVLEGFYAVGCELTAEYIPIIEGRLAHASRESA